MKKVIKIVAIFFVCFFNKPNFLFSQVPLNMNPTGAMVFSDNVLLNCAANINSKVVMTNDPKIWASVTDLSDAMKDSQYRLFQAYGLIPMMITVENRADTSVKVSPDVLEYGVGLSLDKVKDAIMKNFKLKKYGVQASIIAYQLFILAAITTMIVYFPYPSVYSCFDYLISSNALYNFANACTTLFNQTPAIVKFLTGSLTAGLALRYLNPNTFAKVSHTLVDKYYSVKAFLNAPHSSINELDRAIDFVVAESGKKDFEIKSNSSGKFIVFVKSVDADNIKRERLFPILKFAY